MARFFINTGDGIEYRDTEEEARKVAEEAIAFWRKAAINDGEWSDEITDVFWAEIRERVKAVSVDGDEDYTDYQLRAI